MGIDILLAKAQIRLAHWTLFAFIVLLGGLVGALYAPPSTAQTVIITMLTSLLATFATVFVLQHNYFFARSRPKDLPEPPSTSDGVAARNPT